jgi:predicted ATPase
MSLADSIVEYLRDRQVLVVLDNCEHLLSDAAWLASQILQRAPKAKLLATSREGLGVTGEQLVALASLPVPRGETDVVTVGASDAVRLFVDRATARRAQFTLDASNAASVTEICRRLDGMPLAIELAAARVTAMSPVEIAAKLDERFRLLTGGRRSRVERHQTLRATVEWSYSLLDPTERLVFDRLGVFVGTFDATAAEAVIADDDVESWDVLDSLASLVEKSMVLAEVAEDGTTRYWLLETLRAFAREQLEDRDETDAWRRRHATHYAAFCERAGPELAGRDELVWKHRIDAEIDNIRAALTWGADAPDQADTDLALRALIGMASNLARFQWDLTAWASQLVASARSSELPGRALILAAAAGGYMLDDQYELAEQLAREALELPADAAAQSIGWSYFCLASIRYRQGRVADALEIIEEGHRALDATGVRNGAHGPLHGNASLFSVAVGDLETARREAEIHLELGRRSGNPTDLAAALSYLGRASFSDDPARALAAFEESIEFTRAGAADGFHSMALGGAAQLRARAGDRRGALDHLRTVIAFDHDNSSRANAALTLERAVPTLASLGEDELAAMIFGVVQHGTISSFRSLPQVDRTAVRLEERMGKDAYQAAVDRGAAIPYRDVGLTLLAELDRIIDADASVSET